MLSHDAGENNSSESEATHTAKSLITRSIALEAKALDAGLLDESNDNDQTRSAYCAKETETPLESTRYMISKNVAE